jgi:hypothetical protein
MRVAACGKGLNASMVSRRYFLHASGFDPYEAASSYRRFAREAARFAATWSVTAQVSALQQDRPSDSRWGVITRGPGWQVETEFLLLDWSDIVRGAIKEPAAIKLFRGIVAFTDLVRTGTARRYFRANWRYGTFFLVPFLNLFLFAAVAITAGGLAGAAVAAALAGASLAAAGAGVAAAVFTAAAVFAALMRWPGERWRVGQAMADWIFVHDLLRGRRPDMDARIEDFAARIVACAREADVDEIVVAGHSLGAAIAVDALARAFECDPALGRRGPKLALLTIGAVIPKITLHPRGARLHAQVRRLADEPSLTWAEYQARDDFISFYRFDPIALAPTDDVRRPDGPFIGRVQIHRMLGEATWRRVRFNYMRLHYQFVMANELRAAYDYFMLMCGPAPFRRTVTAVDGPAGLYGADGSYAGSSGGDGSGPDVPHVDAPSVAPALPSAANG